MSVAADIPQGTLSRIERGLTAIDAEQIEKLAMAFGMQAEDLVSLARHNAALKVGDSVVYQLDGSLDPSTTKGFRTSASHISKLIAQAKEENGEG